MAYVRLIRPINLLIILITQSILHYFVIVPLCGEMIVLSGFLFPLFALNTAIVAGAGYVINDIIDFKSDLINKPEKTYIPSPVSLSDARIYYWTLVFSGLILALFLAVKTSNLRHIWIYPAATAFLYLYASRLKSTVLWGNVLVSIFIAFVSGILFFAQFTAPESERLSPILIEICLVYMGFAFFVNMVREIIKDIEDMDGDKAQQVVTLPVRFGIERAKSIGSTIIVFQITATLLWTFLSVLTDNFSIRFFLILFIAAPLGRMLLKLQQAKLRSDYASLSKMTKLVMVAGLVSILLVAKNIIH